MACQMTFKDSFIYLNVAHTSTKDNELEDCYDFQSTLGYRARSYLKKSENTYI